MSAVTVTPVTFTRAPTQESPEPLSLGYVGIHLKIRTPIPPVTIDSADKLRERVGAPEEIATSLDSIGTRYSRLNQREEAAL